MAGSLKYFEYTTDAADVFALLCDESNVEAISADLTGDYDATSTVAYHLPGNIKPRYAVYSNAARTRNIKIPVLNPTEFANLETVFGSITDPIAGTGTLTLTRKVPEKMTLLPQAADTGLTDGDAT